MLSCLLGLSGRNDHSGIRNCNANHGNDLLEDLIRYGVAEITGINIVCRADSRHTDRVWSNALCCLQMLCMHQDTNQLVAVALQTKQNAKTNIVDAALHRTIHCLSMICIIMLWSGWM